MSLRQCDDSTSSTARVIYLKGRNFEMLKKDLIMKNPLRLMGHQTDDILGDGDFGAVLARAGVGKTALAVQLAINAQLRKQNVLHIALKDPVKKVCLWYDEVFRNIVEHYDVPDPDKLHEEIIPHRFIMTFRVEGFSVPVLEERLTGLMEQGIFVPKMIVIDGFPFHDQVRTPLEDLKAMAKAHGFYIWFTVTAHRHKKPGANGFPPDFSQVANLFEVVIQLLPEGKEILIKSLKGGPKNMADSPLRLNTSTLLLVDQS